jgi:hypothetical protein
MRELEHNTQREDRRITSNSKNEARTTKQVERRSHRRVRCVLQLVAGIYENHAYLQA